MPNDLQWYHIVASTYGAWLYGDPRGFRTRHHREHVEGDYKDPPPPGKYARDEQRSKKLLKQPPVVILWEFRVHVAQALREKLEAHGALVLCLSVSSQHVHILAKLQRYQARTLMGYAKLHAWHELRDRGWTGKLWGKRSLPKPIRDRQHQLNTYRYILRHAEEGAYVWDLMRERKK